MNRGEIHQLADGAKTVLIVQADAVTAGAPTVIALPVTTVPQRAGYPLTVALQPGDGLTEPAWVKVTAPQMLPRAALVVRLARLDDDTQTRVDQALLAVLALDDPC